MVAFAADFAGAFAAGFSDADMQGVVGDLGELLVGGDGHEHVGRFHAYLEFEEIIVFEDAHMALRAFDHRFRTGLAIFFQQIPLERAGVDPDPH